MIEREQPERQRQPAVVKQVAAVLDDGLHLKMVHFTAALQRRESRRFDKELLLFAAVDPGIVAALFVGIFGRRFAARLACAGAGGFNPALAQKPGRPFVGVAAVLAKEFALQISQKGFDGGVAVKHPDIAG